MVDLLHSQPGGVSNGNSQQQFLSLPSPRTFPGVLSICMWYNPASNSANYPRLIELSNGMGADNTMLRRDSTNNNLAFEIFRLTDFYLCD